MHSLASTTDFSVPLNPVPAPQAKRKAPGPVVLEAGVDLYPGDVLRVEHVRKGRAHCLADNPLTGPFSDASDLVGRVVAREIPEGTTITGMYLAPLGPSQMATRLRNFWRKCK